MKLLVETRRPATLSELRIGGNWDIEADAPELRTVFPRLARSLDVEWRRILKVLSEQRATDLKFDVEKLPRLEPLPDAQVDGVGPEHVLLGLKLEVDKRKELGMIAALVRSFTTESLDKLAIALGQQFILAGTPANMKWGFQAIGRIGGAASVAWIASHVGEWTHARAVQGAELMGQIKSPTAIWEIYAMVMDPALNRPRREDASQVLARVANQRAMDIDRLLDRSVPPVVPETKKRATRSAAKVEMHDPRSRIRDAAIRRLEAHMIDGRRIAHRDFVHYFVRHPVIAPLARRLVWATYERVDVEATFRLDEDGNAVDAHGDVLDLDGATVGVLHPAELAPDERRGVLAAWRKVMIEPLFPQLDRAVHDLRDTDRGSAITRFKLRSVGFDQLRTFETTLDWAPAQEDADGGPLTVGWSKLFRRDGVLAHAAVDGGSIGQLTVTRNGERVAFATLHTATASEILAAVERATTASEAVEEDADVDDAAGDEADRFIEAATTGVKAQPPAKGTLEKGVKVRWSKGRHSGTGTVFWIGQNKFGDGMRAGVKDDETGETVWADADDCKPM